MMKMNKISIFAAIAVIAVSCKQEGPEEFVLDTDTLEVEATGGSANVRVSSPGNWVASTNVPWITVSPANGIGSELIQIIVDSSVVFASEAATRPGVVRIESLSGDGSDRREINVIQKNFPYQIALDETRINIPNYDIVEDRWFEVKVMTNANFLVEPKYAGEAEASDWLSIEEQSTLNLDRGARPRPVTLRFAWNINALPDERTADVNLVPVDAEGNRLSEEAFSRHDLLSVIQGAAARIKENSREGDSTALIGIAQSLGVWAAWDSSLPMERWDDVELWESDDETLDGRVRSVRFFMYSTTDYLPFQVQYLTAAEEIVFYSNENSFLRENMEIGPYLLNLAENGRLKRLTISAHGLDDLPAEFARFKNLEYLNLSSNNFKKIPDVLTPENFPNLHALLLNTNQRRLVYDMSNAAVAEDRFSTYYGGLYDENAQSDNQIDGGTGRGFPMMFLNWDKLDTLTLSVNYLSGELPTDQQLRDLGYPVYTQADYDAQQKDTLATYLLDNRIPKVLTNMKRFSINLNRFSGTLPDWVLYHPNLDLWDPLSLVFPQEGRSINGVAAGFSNEPDNLDYYYMVYPNKRYSPTYTEDENE